MTAVSDLASAKVQAGILLASDGRGLDAYRFEVR